MINEGHPIIVKIDNFYEQSDSLKSHSDDNTKKNEKSLSVDVKKINKKDFQEAILSCKHNKVNKTREIIKEIKQSLDNMETLLNMLMATSDFQEQINNTKVIDALLILEQKDMVLISKETLEHLKFIKSQTVANSESPIAQLLNKFETIYACQEMIVYKDNYDPNEYDQNGKLPWSEGYQNWYLYGIKYIF